MSTATSIERRAIARDWDRIQISQMNARLTSEPSEANMDLPQNATESSQRSCTHCRVAANVRQNWMSSGYTVLKTIECDCNGGTLFIRGTVSTFYYKQMAQELARSVDGVDQIVNELTVAPSHTTKEVKGDIDDIEDHTT